MIEWRLLPEDVARIRFAFSPLQELIYSLVALRAPGEHSLHLPWVRATRPLIVDLDLAEVFAIAPVHGFIADFLTPAPSVPQPDIASEFDTILRTDPSRVVADVADVPHVPEGVAVRIDADPGAALVRIVDTLQAYWQMALAAHWPRILRLLDADVMWRSQRLATGGFAALFEDLHETVRLEGNTLTAADPFDYIGDLSGEGLTLVPHAMGWPRVRKMVAPYQPEIAYPVRGVATLWETAPPEPPDALAALLGRTRAAILLHLAEPASTTTLAHRIHVTPGAVSQHLSVLLASGLVSRTRVAGSVLYRRTTRGDSLTQ